MFRLRIVQGRRQIVWGRPNCRRRGCACSRKQLRLARQDPVVIRTHTLTDADSPNMPLTQMQFSPDLIAKGHAGFRVMTAVAHAFRTITQ